MAFQVYKSGQGRHIRVGTAIGAGLLALVLVWHVSTVMSRHMAGSAKALVYIRYIVPFVVLAAVVVLGALYLNKPKVVDFFIATESEMKKVSWSSKAELWGSTTVVLVTIILLGLLIAVLDFVFIGGLYDGWTIPYTVIHIPGLGL